MCRSSRRCAASPLSEACAGTAFIDTVSITKANVKVLEDGDKWLIYNRKKTGTLARVKLLPEALELMAKYEDGARDTLFPLLSTNRVRIDLITICKLAETSKTYSYHSGRHSFASLITLEAGVQISLKNIRQFWEIEPAWIPWLGHIAVYCRIILKQHSH